MCVDHVLYTTCDDTYAIMETNQKISCNRFLSITLILFMALGCSRENTSVNENSRISGLQNLSKDKVSLGEMLFHEPRLSSNNSISCAHCHNLAAGGGDSRPGSIGVNGGQGDVNSPTVFNAVKMMLSATMPNLDTKSSRNTVVLPVTREAMLVAISTSNLVLWEITLLIEGGR